MMKRCREGSADVEDVSSMANCLMLLSGDRAAAAAAAGGGVFTRVFECKTCNRQFPSFQALGGHRASHKKPRLQAGGDHLLRASSSPPKPKTHECSICGLEFAIGQALGGHMRRHRAAMNDQNQQSRSPPLPSSVLSLSPPLIVKKSKSTRVLCLDLNLTPSENKFLFGKVAAPAVDCFF
ncbi:zinc finger protein ZAT11-like [Sesamum indicum]|uniref:Zinc finger protein ZAT11-like n=1 Tax=Sesamum indicum TaxID=4182 RepID=A0A8M8UXX9_SESIN|nr:zinc finger protein ZAT11-like [Sesamum indicum]